MQAFAAGHVEWAGQDPPTSGFVLLANDASGGIVERLKGGHTRRIAG